MTTTQPNWKLVGRLGDVNPVVYGGGFVYEDLTGVYPPEVELIVPSCEDEDETRSVMVYRFVLDRPRFKTLTTAGKRKGLQSAELPASERGKTWDWHEEWFVSHLEGIAETYGTTKFKMLRMLFSKNTMERALAYEMLTGYHSLENFDSYPLTMTEDEANARYAGENTNV